MIKGLFIDIDNTLYDYETAHCLAISAVECMIESIVDKEIFKKAYTLAREYVHNALKNTASSHNRLLYFQKTLEILEINNYLYAKKMYDLYWDTFLNNIKLYDGVIDLLKLFDKNKICFVTDLTAYIQYKKIEKLGLNKYVGYIVTSEEAGVEKPSKRIYDLALKKLKLTYSSVCMIGDSYKKDYLGAKQYGIDAFLFDNKNLYSGSDIKCFSDYLSLKKELECLMS